MQEKFSKIRGLYAILDIPHPSGWKLAELAQAYMGKRPHSYGACVLQLRAKYANTEERITMIDQLAPICRAANSLLIVNDDVKAALAVGSLVDGVHLGQEDLQKVPSHHPVQFIHEQAKQSGCTQFIVGVSTHNLDQLTLAVQQGADYVGFGPIWPTVSKQNPEAAVGLSNLSKACQLASCPVVAIGGIHLNNVKQVINAGASAVAVISALTGNCLGEICDQAYYLAHAIEHFED